MADDPPRRDRRAVWLSFDYFHASGDCDTPFVGPIAWEYDVGTGGWISWTWAGGGADDLLRKFTHTTSEATGDVYDNGQRWDAAICGQ